VKLRVLLADDHPFVRLGVRCTLEAGGIEVVGEASGASELLALIAAVRCDAVVTDLAMPGTPGGACERIAFVRQLRERWPALPVIVLTGETDASMLAALRQTGIAALLLKSDPPDLLSAAVRDVCCGHVSVGETGWAGCSAGCSDTRAGLAARGYGQAGNPVDPDRTLFSVAARHALR